MNPWFSNLDSNRELETYFSNLESNIIMNRMIHYQ